MAAFRAPAGRYEGDVPRRWQRVRVPWRLITSAACPDVSVSVYVKVAALAARKDEDCTAGVARLADFLGVSKASVERGLRALMAPDPADGVIELVSTRRTLPGGRGQTAVRRTRELEAADRWVWVPVVAAEVLAPRELRAWLALRYAQLQGLEPTLAEVAGTLIHHRGRRAGESVSGSAAASVVAALVRKGWLWLDRRAGRQGRHVFLAVDPTREQMPLPVDSPAAVRPSGEGGAPSGDGSGARDRDGSLTYEEDRSIDRQVPAGDLSSSAEGDVRKYPREAVVDNPPAGIPSPPPSNRALRADDPTARPSPPTPPGATASRKTASGPGGYSGPALTYSARVNWVLEPVRWLLRQPGVTRYVQREAGRRVGQLLNSGTEPERLRARLQSRFARTGPSDIRRISGWLLAVPLVRWGCQDPMCEEGILWDSGESCSVCAAVIEQRRLEREQQAAPAAPRCAGCGVGVPAPGCCPGCAPRADARRPRPSPAPRTVAAPVAAEVRLVRWCAGCRSRLEDGRCRTCGLAESVQVHVRRAMDAAAAGLSGAAKVPAAAAASAQMRERVEQARRAARETGLSPADEHGACVRAAEDAADSICAAPDVTGVCP